MQGLARIGAALLIALVQPPAHAQALTVRAVDPNLNDELIRYVARNAVPIDLHPQQVAGISPLTPRNIVYRLCGKVTSAYWAAYWPMVLEANQGFDLGPDTVLSEPDDIAWPKCLFANNVPQRVVVRRNDTVSSIYLRLTGSPGTEKTWPAFFGVASVRALNPLAEGKALTGSYKTVPIVITPKREITPEAFQTELKKIEQRAGKEGALVWTTLIVNTGRVVVAVPSDETAFLDRKCIPFPSTDSPLGSPLAIKEAYANAWKHPRKSEGQARIVVIDNGFFGADPTRITAEKGLFWGSPFPSGYFVKKPGNDQLLAQSISTATTDTFDGQLLPRASIDPSNYVHNLVPDNSTVVHGTHVTGLTLGGPDFSTHRDNLRGGTEPWAKITILNVGKGDEALIAGAQDHVSSQLRLWKSQPLLVNMSISYDGGVDDSIRSVFSAMRDDMSKESLLVVAAGNDATDVAQLVPAALGGTISENVVTVAAHDASGSLAPFSNFDSDRVDIAAPGCEIPSWTRNDVATSPLSGTSMATPLVTFAAALIRSLDSGAKGGAIKARLIASGDFLVWDKARPLAHGGMRLNIPKSLHLFHDYVRLGAEEVLGKVDRFPSGARRCRNTPVRSEDEVWSVKKREDGSGVLFHGKVDQRILSCEIPAESWRTGELQFAQTHRITDKGVIVPDARDRRVPMSDVSELIFRAR